MQPTVVHSILVVDDDPDDLIRTVDILGKDYQVWHAASGAEALHIAQNKKPAVIILDVMMPGGMDGFAVFKALQCMPQTRCIPVIFLTGVNRISNLPFSETEIERYLGGHPAAFLEKPVHAAALLQAVAGSVRLIVDMSGTQNDEPHLS